MTCGVGSEEQQGRGSQPEHHSGAVRPLLCRSQVECAAPASTTSRPVPRPLARCLLSRWVLFQMLACGKRLLLPEMMATLFLSKVLSTTTLICKQQASRGAMAHRAGGGAAAVLPVPAVGWPAEKQPVATPGDLA